MAKKTQEAPAGAAPDAHSGLVGGSTAAIRLNCPGSYQMEQKLPKVAKEESSAYADEGTACHEAMAYMLANDIVDANEVLGMEFGRAENPFVMTQELVDDCLQPAIRFFDQLVDELEQESGMLPVWEIEQRVEMPGIPDAFGTCDLVLYTSKRTVILDWKFGSGVPVKASYIQTDDDGEWEVLNPQLMYYARAAQHTMPGRFGNKPDWPVSLIIAQPRARGDENQRYTRAETDLKELEDFRWALVRAISEATGKNPRINRGEHCRFAKCKVICPKWVGPVLDLGKALEAKEARRATPIGDTFDYGDIYAAILDLAEFFEPLVKAARDQAHTYMENGGVVPGWKLVPKRAIRAWKDTKDAEAVLRGAGCTDKDLFKVELNSPAQMEKVLKKMKQELPEELVSKVSSGTTLAPEDDKRAAVIPMGVVVQNFAEKLALVAPKE